MITINTTKAKQIAHTIRRERRAEEFKPFDDMIAKQLPGTNVSAIEASRQIIRDKYAVMQQAIDTATTAEELKNILS